MTDFSRERMIGAADGKCFDVVIVGGGASGLGVAVDSAARGYSTCLVEAHDFAKGTSSRSTKLVHGGVRYLEQLDLGLVMEALHERGLMHENAPHLVHDLAFIVPRYTWWEGPFYGAGLKLYDLLAGKRNLAPSRMLSVERTIEAIPNVARDGLLGSIEYHDGQFDDARMAVTLARTAADLGAVVINRARAIRMEKDPSGRICGIACTDMESGRTFDIRARVVVNACGIFSDEIRRLDDHDAVRMIEPAQGIHLVLDRSFLPGNSAIMVPHTDDGRVLFVVPWHGRVIVGTTDTPMKEPSIEPRAQADEVEFVLRNAARYLQRDPARGDVLSVFAGMRPLVHEGGVDAATKSISRSHKVVVSAGGLVSVMGGKWTTYRKMAEDTLNRAAEAGGLAARPCSTDSLRVRGWSDHQAEQGEDAQWLRVYGSDAPAVSEMCAQRPEWRAPLHPRLPYQLGAAAWAVRHEMARSTEDVLARRTRALLLDAKAAMECADSVARVVAEGLGRDEAFARQDAESFRQLAKGYTLAE